MDISAALAADLAVLTQALDTDDADLETQLNALTADLQLAVTSYTGMTMTIALDGRTVSFSVHDNPTSAASPATSLLIPLAALTTTDTASTLLLYAATPGAFVDLAADLRYTLGIGPATLVLDGHLTAPATGPGMIGLDTHFALDQAIGVLIGRGHTPETARDELHRLASLDHGDLHAAAEQIILSASPPTPDTT
ncbi:MAG: hypothetical protein QOJ37_3620 [Pseudonocardiales bacterium]|nr:hypothetical protein [Pseudonocardiales bacterium]